MTCRKSHASVSNPFVVFRRADLQVVGEVRSWRSSPGYVRWFCSVCGSRVFAESRDEVEISMGSLDELGAFSPQYEVWTARREPWLPQLPVPQFSENRPEVSRELLL
jgi:hypothetical protein